MSRLTGLYFLRFQRVDENKINITRGQILYPVGHDADKELGPYLCAFPGVDGKYSHSALIFGSEFTSPEYLLFSSGQAAADFLAAQQAAAQQATAPAQTETPVATAPAS